MSDEEALVAPPPPREDGMTASAEIIDCPSREAWLEVRRQGIGASEAAAILGISPWQTAADIWSEKVGLISQVEQTAAMQWGLYLEPAIAAAYQDETGRLVDRHPYRVLRSREHPWLLATLDGVIEDPTRGPGIWEAKTASQRWEDEPPLWYQVQNQHQLAVSGYQWGVDVVLVAGRELWHTEFVPQLEFHAVLIERLAAFWDLVQRQEPPDLSASARSREILRALYPREAPGATIALPAEGLQWDRELVDVKRQLSELAARKEALETSLKRAIGEHETGVLSDGTRYTWRSVTKSGYTVEPTTYRELRRRAGRL